MTSSRMVIDNRKYTGGRRQVHGVDNWFNTASSLGLVARRQIMLMTLNKDQSIREDLLYKLVLESCPITDSGPSYKMRGEVLPIVGILRYL